MTTMIERVARAIFASDYPEGGEASEVMWEKRAGWYRDAARAAIAAMREGAGDLIANPPHPYFWPDGSNAPVVVSRLFDAALEEKP